MVTIEMKAEIDELRNRIDPKLLGDTDYDTDFCLLRWLQGFDGDLEVIVPKLKRHLEARKAWDLSRTFQEESEATLWRNYYFSHFLPVQDENSQEVFCYEQIGRVDCPGVCRAYSILDMFRNRVFAHEMMLQKILEQERRTGRQTRVLFVLDMEGVDLSAEIIRFCLGPIKCLAAILQENYVEIYSRVVLVNAHSFMVCVWRFLQPLLPKKTAEKIEILGSEWEEQIFKFVPAESWPIELGGRLDYKIRPILPVPKENYQSVEDNALPDSEVLWVPAGKECFKVIRITEPGSQIAWSFKTNREFRLAMYFTENENETDIDSMETVFPFISRYHGPLENVCRVTTPCKKAGYYKIWFRNQFSWLTSLKVVLSYRVLPPVSSV